MISRLIIVLIMMIAMWLMVKIFSDEKTEE